MCADNLKNHTYAVHGAIISNRIAFFGYAVISMGGIITARIIPSEKVNMKTESVGAFGLF